LEFRGVLPEIRVVHEGAKLLAGLFLPNIFAVKGRDGTCPTSYISV
jgi:hypothetical protein